MPTNFPDGWSFQNETGAGGAAAFTIPPGGGGPNLVVAVRTIRHVLTWVKGVIRVNIGGAAGIYAPAIAVQESGLILHSETVLVDATAPGTYEFEFERTVMGSAGLPMLVFFNALPPATIATSIYARGYDI